MTDSDYGGENRQPDDDIQRTQDLNSHGRRSGEVGTQISGETAD